jgi:hypothetical protein
MFLRIEYCFKYNVRVTIIMLLVLKNYECKLKGPQSSSRLVIIIVYLFHYDSKDVMPVTIFVRIMVQTQQNGFLSLKFQTNMLQHLGATTFSITTLVITRPSIKGIDITRLSIMT